MLLTALVVFQLLQSFDKLESYRREEKEKDLQTSMYINKNARKVAFPGLRPSG